MIRRIHNLDEIQPEQLAKLGRLFVEEAKIGVDFDVEHFTNRFGMALQAGVGALWVMDEGPNVVGLIGGMATDFFFSKTLCAIEAFWFVSREHRRGFGGMRLLDEFIRWSEVEMGVKFVHLAYMEGIHPEKMAQFYEAQGFMKLETVYRKRV